MYLYEYTLNLAKRLVMDHRFFIISVTYLAVTNPAMFNSAMSNNAVSNNAVFDRAICMFTHVIYLNI